MMSTFDQQQAKVHETAVSAKMILSSLFPGQIAEYLLAAGAGPNHQEQDPQQTGRQSRCRWRRNESSVAETNLTQRKQRQLTEWK